jgi:hypothetical protein
MVDGCSQISITCYEVFVIPKGKCLSLLSKERKYHPCDTSTFQASTLRRNSATTMKHAAKKFEAIEKTFASMAH